MVGAQGGVSGLRARVETHLLRVWYGGEPPGIALRALTRLHSLLRWLRPRAASPAALAVPVIVVGNLVAGGSGKTPLVIALARRLRLEGFRPGVLSRGHGRRGKGLVLLNARSRAVDVGDEPLLIAAGSDVPVAVCARRRQAAEALIAQGCDVLISDDGLQHRSLPRSIEIEVVDGQRGYGNGRLLPAGPLREPIGRKVDLRVVNGPAADNLRRADDVPMHLQLGTPRALLDDSPMDWESLVGCDCIAIAGIGNPARFFAALCAKGLTLESRAFPDHHAYTAADLEFANARTLLMTDKDAIKCREFAQPGWYRVPATAHLPEAFYAQILQRLRPT